MSNPLEAGSPGKKQVFDVQFTSSKSVLIPVKQSGRKVMPQPWAFHMFPYVSQVSAHQVASLQNPPPAHGRRPGPGPPQASGRRSLDAAETI